jgi:hypothetical protein
VLSRKSSATFCTVFAKMIITEFGEVNWHFSMQNLSRFGSSEVSIQYKYSVNCIIRSKKCFSCLLEYSKSRIRRLKVHKHMMSGCKKVDIVCFFNQNFDFLQFLTFLVRFLNFLKKLGIKDLNHSLLYWKLEYYYMVVWVEIDSITATPNILQKSLRQ